MATVVVFDLRNRNGAQQSRGKFFSELTGQGLFERFAVLDLTAGKFPFERRRVLAAALADQQTAVGTFNHRSNDANAHGRTPENSLRIREIRRAPAMSGGPGVLRSSSCITKTCLRRTAGTACQSGKARVLPGSVRFPVAAHASRIISGRADATSLPETREPGLTTILPPQRSMSSKTQGGELILGLGQASE